MGEDCDSSHLFRMPFNITAGVDKAQLGWPLVVQYQKESRNIPALLKLQNILCGGAGLECSGAGKAELIL